MFVEALLLTTVANLSIQYSDHHWWWYVVVSLPRGFIVATTAAFQDRYVRPSSGLVLSSSVFPWK